MDLDIIPDILETIVEPDPYLQYQPTFAYTLPIQLLVNGITFTLLCVLLIHLLFTTQYHYPLAPLNYILQFFSILTVLISVVIKIIVILQHTAKSADIWPYDLDYVAVSIPPPTWNTGRCAAWFLLQALNNGLSNITHIQFLTMLYPSRTEARLIMFVLGPLAIASSALVFSALSPHQTVLDISDAIRNVFNSTLLLIFTISLIIWGFFVNRRRAWRFDGGTAVFGFGSLLLALISTSFNFVAVAEDGIDWLQHLLFAAILWQIWLGWWWWVGSGMGIGEVEDIMERAERKKRKAAKSASRARAAAADGASTGFNGNTNNSNRIRATSLSGIADNFHTGVTSILKSTRVAASSASGSLTRRNTNRERSYNDNDNDHHRAEEGAIELDDLGDSSHHQQQNRSRSRNSNNNNSQQQHVEFDSQAMEENEESLSRGRNNGLSNIQTQQPGQASTTSETSSTSATPSLHPPKTFGQLISFPTTLIIIYLRKLRKAHEEAAKQQALNRAERRQRVFHDSVSPPNGLTQLVDNDNHDNDGVNKDQTPTNNNIPAINIINDAGNNTNNNNTNNNTSRRNSNTVRYERGIMDSGTEDIGWGLGKFGIREHEESSKRLRQAGERLNEDRLLPVQPEAEPSTSSSRRQSELSRLNITNDQREGNGNSQSQSLPQATTQTQTQNNEEGEWEDIDSSNSSSEPNSRRQRNNRRTSRFRRGRGGGNTTHDPDQIADQSNTANAGSGWSWWGPLKDWRLNDRSAF
ncbi:uncharacterized protein L201_005495 [Kwoniella dendrophila CBS 6074]|uniref:Uncharacterized protein n=1 Tax=Kwoniella dendrophila CBS 6074 TaxID=1295534 RepID=A0AAX4K078_9TREE